MQYEEHGVQNQTDRVEPWLRCLKPMPLEEGFDVLEPISSSVDHDP